MSTAASVTMAADSTQGDLHEDQKKKKKHKSHKKYKKQKRRDSSSDSSVDSDLDLDKEMHPISHYVKDRDVLVQQLFKSITTAKLRAMLPEVLKPYSIEELRSFCLEQLEVMSKKRILRILQGEDPENISSSGTDDETDEEKEKAEGKKVDNFQANAEAVTSGSVSETEGTNESAAMSGAEEVEEVEEEVEEVVEEDNEEDEIEVVEEEVEEEEGSEEEVVEEVIVEEEGTEGEEEEVEYEEVEIEVEEDETEEEGQRGSEEDQGEVDATGDIRKVEIKTDASSKTSKTIKKPKANEPELQLHAEQEDFDEPESGAPSVDKSKKTKLSKPVKNLQVATSQVKSTQNPPAAETQKRRVKLKRDTILPSTAEISAKSSLISENVQQPQAKRTVKAVKRKSSDGDPLSENIEPSTSGPTEILLSKNQMEILELEMRARAIKAMLKMHSTE